MGDRPVLIPGSGALGGLLEQVGLQAGVFAIRGNWVEGPNVEIVVVYPNVADLLSREDSRGGCDIVGRLVGLRDRDDTRELVVDEAPGFVASVIDLVGGSDVRGILVAGATGELANSRDIVGAKEPAVDTTAGFDESTVDPVNASVVK